MYVQRTKNLYQGFGGFGHQKVMSIHAHTFFKVIGNNSPLAVYDSYLSYKYFIDIIKHDCCR